MRLTKIYTRKGDKGFTRLAGQRLPKDDVLVETVGTLDELNSFIGFILALGIKNSGIKTILLQIQNDLFDLGGELHLPEHITITADKVTQLEQWLDGLNSNLPPLKEFILPGGNQPSAVCHIARTVCRRAERCLAKLHHRVPLQNLEILRYLNRLSDLLFVIARTLAKATHEQEIMWQPAQ